MTDQVAPPAVPTQVERRPVAAAALAALGVYLVLVGSRVLEGLGYIASSYAVDPLSYLDAMFRALGPSWFLAPIPYAFATWLGLGMLFPIRPHLSTRAVVGRGLLTALVALVVTGLLVGIGVVVATAGAYLGAGYRSFSIDELSTLVPRLLGNAGSTTVGFLTSGTLAVLLAALLLRDRRRVA